MTQEQKAFIERVGALAAADMPDYRTGDLGKRLG